MREIVSVKVPDATKQVFPERILLWGPPGSGKTKTALNIAEGLKGDGRIGVVDIDFGRSREYADQHTFALIVTKDTKPSTILQAIRDLAEDGCSVVVVDGLGNVWEEVKETKSALEQRGGKYKNGVAAWGDAKVPLKRMMTELRGIDIHIIATTGQTGDGDGRPIPVGPMFADLKKGISNFRIVYQLTGIAQAVLNVSDLEQLDKRVIKPTIELGKKILQLRGVLK